MPQDWVNSDMRRICLSGQAAHFEGYRLKGNLRSSANITELMMNFGAETAFTHQEHSSFVRNIRLEKAIELQGPRPHIEIVGDNSLSRDTFFSKALEVLGRMTRSHGKGNRFLFYPHFLR